MSAKSVKQLLTIEHLPVADIEEIFRLARQLKLEGVPHCQQPLKHQVWALIFAKSSTRTRVSFEVGIRQLGGDALFLNTNDIQLGRGEAIKDTARVLGRMVQGAIIRTFAQRDVEEFAQWSGLPTINALTDEEHPCQILADIFTYEERRGSIRGKTVAFIGDGACNVPVSWMFAAAKFGFNFRIVAPKAYQPDPSLLERAGSNVSCTSNIQEGAAGADLLYTDVWVSMGKEAESAERLRELKRYQINDQVLSYAKKDALVMHCLPAYRGKEIAESTFDAHAETIFAEAENRLHLQKGILQWAAPAFPSTAK